MITFTFMEIFDIVLMTLALGFIFKDVFARFSRPRDYDPLLNITKKFDTQAFKFACYVTAPAIILHELGHKFVALFFGAEAVFHAAYTWLGIGILLKLMNFGFIFFVPAYVSFSAANLSSLQYSAIAFAGPGVNLLLWLLSLLAIKKKLLHKRYNSFLFLTSRINMFLFIFNMLPFGMFDGYKVFSGITQYVLSII